MLIIYKGTSIISIPHSLDVPVIGRIKLSEIYNIDQSPLLFKFLKGHIYAKKGEKTIRLKGSKSRHNKHIYTLQITIFTDGIPRYKPLLMFKGKPKSKDRCRRIEAKRYHPSIIVIFNKKTYTNTSNLINWVKNQYSIASAYPL
jgi:hypothetical protein